ncbi:MULTISPECIES: substrate-binding and VWA domain-containing protein [Actinoplanes]|uniref:substrate-binding and VWA domain-containing protein n=1 Tax=Actinoplanes TaxID=1865 RepID=UPI000698539E|nr:MULTISPECIES: substrate-binding and VWA domain-containing protein [Actinoplanes]
MNVAPSVTDPVREVAERLAGRTPCLEIDVVARESSDVLRTLGGAAPDVWVPESTLWLRRARAAGAFQVPAEGVPVATTPVVLAVDRRAAGRVPRSGWAGLVGAAKPPLRVALPDPATSPLGFATLVGVRRLAGSDAATTAAMMRRLAPDTIPVTGETVPAPDATTAVVSTEQQVKQATGQTAVYPSAALPGPDYPYAVLTSDAPARAKATALLRALLADEGAAAVTAHGLRAPDGDTPVGLPAEQDSEDLLNAWGGVHISARMLAVFDISGSMESAVPGSADTRLSATVKAAQGGAKLLLGTTELGVWEFSTDLDGGRDYREIVPVGPVGPRRSAIVAELGRMRVEPAGRTGLYDTTLAAYKNATRNWTAGRINMVLILTDGTDDNASGISRAALLRQLGELADRRRPVPILFIGVGPEIDAGELRQIAGATGGRVALTAKPSGIRDIFYTALAEFSCLPPECRR